MGIRSRFAAHSRPVIRSRRWKALRLEALRRDGFACRECGARGRLEVDHIQPVREAPELAYSLDNVQSLCRSCHTRKTRIECGHPEPDPERVRWAESVSAICVKRNYKL